MLFPERAAGYGSLVDGEIEPGHPPSGMIGALHAGYTNDLDPDVVLAHSHPLWGR
jgi:hypothetical protein